MHAEAFAYVARTAQAYGPFAIVVEFGSLDINGSPRSLFPASSYLGVDLQIGPGVDVVTDAAAWRSVAPVDAVVCCEVLEHATDPAGVIGSAFEALAPGGRLILTAACDPRAPHSGHDGGPVRPGEWYSNVCPVELSRWLAPFGKVEIEVDDRHGDVYATGVKV